MFIQCLGSGDAFGSGGRLNSSYYIRTTTMGILLDCGASALIALKKENLSANDIDAIIISHLHGDHFGGLAFVLCEIIAVGKRAKPLTIIGPDKTEERTRQVLELLFPGVELTAGSPVRFVTFTTDEVLQFESLSLTVYPAAHSPATNPHALRLVADGTTIAYSGDTEWTDTLISASMDADLFICEASTYNTGVRYHLSAERLLAELPRIRAKKIVLTHLGDEALKHIDAIPLTIARDGMILKE